MRFGVLIKITSKRKTDEGKVSGRALVAKARQDEEKGEKGQGGLERDMALNIGYAQSKKRDCRGNRNRNLKIRKKKVKGVRGKSAIYERRRLQNKSHARSLDGY